MRTRKRTRADMLPAPRVPFPEPLRMHAVSGLLLGWTFGVLLVQGAARNKWIRSTCKPTHYPRLSRRCLEEARKFPVP